ncbi:MAG: radical SAM protein, partial [Duncaniella dubosii]|nr:radical SAM protein [Duncaniella dubosii]
RRYRHLNSSHLSKIGVVMKRARYFITCGELTAGTIADTSPEYVRRILTMPRKPKGENPLQLSFDFS